MDDTKEHVVSISDGEARFVYDDALAGVVADMGGTVTRASHVEPHPTRPGWLADMRPSGGPVLGLRCEEHGGESGLRDSIRYEQMDPFATRADALAAERAWLREHRGL